MADSENMMFYGVIQAYDGQDSVYMYTDAQIKEALENKGISTDILPENTDTPVVADINWPMDGKDAEATSVYRITGVRNALDFLEQDARGPASDDPTISEIAKYQWTIETNERNGCAGTLFDEYNIPYGRYLQIDPRLNALYDVYRLKFDDFSKPEIRDIRYSEIEEKLPAAIKEMEEHMLKATDIKDIKYISSEYCPPDHSEIEFTANIDGKEQPLHYEIWYHDNDEEFFGIHTDENDIYSRMNGAELQNLAYILDNEAKIGRYEKNIEGAGSMDELKEVLYEYMDDERFPIKMKPRFDRAYAEKENELGINIEEDEIEL